MPASLTGYWCQLRLGERRPSLVFQLAAKDDLDALKAALSIQTEYYLDDGSWFELFRGPSLVYARKGASRR